MTGISDGKARDVPTARGRGLGFRKGGRSGTGRPTRALTLPRDYSKLNEVFSWVIVAIVVLSAVPAASNRPVFWMIWAVVLFGAAMIHMMVGAFIAPERDLRIWKHGPILAVAALVPIWATIQLIPGLGPLVATHSAEGITSSATISLVPGATGIAILRLTSYLVFFALVLEVGSRPDRAIRMAWLVFFAVAALTLYGLVELAFLGDEHFWGEKDAYLGYATGTFINRNAYASWIGLAMCLGLALTLRHVHRARVRNSHHGHFPGWSWVSADNVGLFVLLGLMGLTLLATGSRTGIASSLAAIVTVFFVMERKRGASWRGLLLPIGIACVSLFALMLASQGLEISARFASSLQDSSARLPVYRTLIDMISDRPIAGYGLDSFEMAFELRQRDAVMTEVTWQHAHSSYLGNWMELGLFAGSLPLAASLLVLIALIRRLRRRESGIALPACALGALVLLSLHATIDFTFEIQANLFLLLFILGLGLTQGEPISRRVARDGSQDQAVGTRQETIEQRRIRVEALHTVC